MSEQPTPWKVPGKWLTSMHNWAEDVRKGWTLPKEIIIHDTTLRDGEQTPGVVFRKDEKVKIAHALADIGVDRIEGGMPAVSPEDAEAIKQMVKEIKTAEIVAFARARKDDIDKAIECKVGRVVIEVPARNERIAKIWGTREKTAEDMVNLIKHAKNNGLKVTLFLVDYSRASLSDIETLIIPGVKEAKADGLAVVDTRGTCLPGAMAFLVKNAKAKLDVPVEAHCHDQWGLGTANTLAAITAGAAVVHTCVNGLGGNACLDECVVTAKALLGVKTRIQTERLFALSQMVKEYSRTDFYKPFIGQGVADIEIGIATRRMWDQRTEHGWGRIDSLNYEVVGQPAVRLVLGKKSGRYSPMLKAYELKLPIPTEEQAEAMLTEIKLQSENKKGLVSDDEFKKIYDKVMAAK